MAGLTENKAKPSLPAELGLELGLEVGPYGSMSLSTYYDFPGWGWVGGWQDLLKIRLSLAFQLSWGKAWQNLVRLGILSWFLRQCYEAMNC